MSVPKVLYINRMKNENTEPAQESVHILFDDGSMMRIQVEKDISIVENTQQGAQLLLYQMLELVEQMPTSQEEIAPMCLGDTTCMYCNGKGCVNCKRV
ncbi:MAG: hypothetical protein JEZ00_01170 [Anaerolineaceae bacterium]|nr:hypothetical protein [Anaerolineaceae bacterium]